MIRASITAAVAVAVALAAGGASGSPDAAGVIAYVATGKTSADIAVIGAGGAGRRQLTHSAKHEYALCPAWSPDGRTIAALDRQESTSPVTGGSWVEALSAGGKRLWRVAADAACPSWSPDGRNVAYFATAKSGALDLWVVGANGRNAHRLVAKVDGRLGNGAPAWSPDSSEIAYYRESDTDSGDFLIPTVKLDGTAGPTVHAHRSAPFCSDYCQLYSAWMTWAPAKSIAFIIAGGDLYPEVLYAIDPDGSHQRLLSGKAKDVYVPAWSRDGSRIAFIVRGPTDQAWIADAEGSGMRQVTRITSHTSNLSGAFDPVWSPDGKQLATDGHAGGVYLTNVASGKSSLLVPKATGPVSWHP